MPLRISALVGVARWDVVVGPAVLEQLAHGACVEEAAIDRLMTSVRDKAVRLRWYGGGTMTIDEGELAPEIAAASVEDENQPLPRTPWYQIIESGAEPRAPRHLTSV